MKSLSWNLEKNEIIKTSRGISFEEIALLIEAGEVVNVLENPGHQGQFMSILEIENNAVVVPYVEGEEEIFLKTAFPSRKYTKRYAERSSK